MTVAIPEAASVAEGIIIPGSSTYETYGTRTLGSRAKAKRPARNEEARRARRRAAQAAADAYAVRAREGAQGAASASVPGDRSYQPVILAEFLIAVVIVAAVPVAAGGSPNAKAKNSPSPYDTGDLRQLVAVGAVYFILSLVSSGNRGRISAWLGGLILIGLGMSKLSKGQLGSLVTAVTGNLPAVPPGGGLPSSSSAGGGSGQDEAQ
jgi:hypothetical protein